MPKTYVGCLTKKAGISDSCASCFEGSGRYGVGNCKLACVYSWCSDSCVACIRTYLPTLINCIGSEPPPPSKC